MRSKGNSIVQGIQTTKCVLQVLPLIIFGLLDESPLIYTGTVARIKNSTLEPRGLGVSPTHSYVSLVKFLNFFVPGFLCVENGIIVCISHHKSFMNIK